MKVQHSNCSMLQSKCGHLQLIWMLQQATKVDFAVLVLHVASSLLPVARCLLPVASCLLQVACCCLDIAKGLLAGMQRNASNISRLIIDAEALGIFHKAWSTHSGPWQWVCLPHALFHILYSICCCSFWLRNGAGCARFRLMPLRVASLFMCGPFVL